VRLCAVEGLEDCLGITNIRTHSAQIPASKCQLQQELLSACIEGQQVRACVRSPISACKSEPVEQPPCMPATLHYQRQAQTDVLAGWAPPYMHLRTEQGRLAVWCALPCKACCCSSVHATSLRGSCPRHEAHVITCRRHPRRVQRPAHQSTRSSRCPRNKRDQVWETSR